MNWDDLSLPNPQRIDRVAPTTANSLFECMLRVAYEKDPQFDTWKRGSEASVIGTATHAVVELARKWSEPGTPESGCRQAVESEWDNVIASSLAELSAQWAPAVPSPPEQWRDYFLKRARALAFATRIATERSARLTTLREAREGGDGVVGIEGWFESLDDQLHGKLDCVERCADGTTRVVDLKSGLKQQEPTGGQLRQLFLYSVLVQRKSGRWPSEIAIEDSSGTRFAQPLEPAVAEDCLREVRAKVGDFNAAAENGSVARLAIPGPDNCRFCKYRVVCPAYWNSIDATWDHPSLAGEVIESGTTRESAFARVKVEAAGQHVSEVVNVVRLAAEPPEGSRGIRLSALAHSFDPAERVSRWSTLIDAG